MRTPVLLLVAIFLLAACSNTTANRAARGAATGAFRGQAVVGAAASSAGGYVYDKTLKNDKADE